MHPALFAGLTLRLTVNLAGYPASEGWALKYRFSPRVAGSPIDVSTTPSGVAHLLDVPPATTAQWAPGAYTCSAWVEHGNGEKHAVPSESGQLLIKPNPTSLSAGVDTRTDAELALAAVQALLKGKADSGVQSYQIAGRELRSYSLAELLRLETKLKTEVAAEQAAAGKPSSGAGSVRRIFVRMP